MADTLLGLLSLDESMLAIWRAADSSSLSNKQHSSYLWTPDPCGCKIVHKINVMLGGFVAFVIVVSHDRHSKTSDMEHLGLKLLGATLMSQCV